MRTLQIAAIALLAFSSAAYAAGDGPYHPTYKGRHFHSAMHQPVDAGQPPVSGFSAYVAPSVAPLSVTGWGPGDAWHNFPGPRNANGG